MAFILVGLVQVDGGQMELAEFFKACRFAAVPLQLSSGNHLIARGHSGTNLVVALVDTGATHTLTAPELAAPLEVLDAHVHSLTDLMGNSIAAQSRVRFSQLTLGGITLPGCSAIVITNLQTLKREPDADPIKRDRFIGQAGPSQINLMLGWNSMEQWGAWLDVGSPGYLYFPVGKPITPNQAKNLGNILRENGFVEVPLANTNQPWAEVAGTVGHQEVRFLVDSGAAFSLFDSEEFGRLATGPDPSGLWISGLAGKEKKSSLAEIKNWQLGPYHPRSYKVTLLPLPTSKKKSEEPGRRPITVILGIDFLAGEQTLLDVAGRRIFFRRPAGRKGKALD